MIIKLRYVAFLLAVIAVSVVLPAYAQETEHLDVRDLVTPPAPQDKLGTDETKGANTQQYFDQYNISVFCVNGISIEVENKDKREYLKRGAETGYCVGTVPTDERYPTNEEFYLFQIDTLEEEATQLRIENEKLKVTVTDLLSEIIRLDQYVDHLRNIITKILGN